jgi:hypothetical protein
MNGEEQVRSLLSGLPRPSMPAGVAEAIAQRLAAESPAAQSPAEVVPLEPAHRRRLSTLLVAACFAALAALLGAGMPATPAPQPGDRPVLHAGAVFTPAGLGGEVSRRYQYATVSSSTGTFADRDSEVLTCVRAVSAYGRLLAIDTGSYDASEAVVLIMRSPLNADYEEVWVVTPACGRGDGQILRHIVYDVDRP